ncbi:MAG: capsule assembly Wzi family protein [Bacteroidales bacterium]|nr:capsule assembly Wzi family protein [Bacteroidales bacterium]
MQKLNIVFKITYLLSLSFTMELAAQSISTGTPVLEDFYRREQLMGKINPNFSFVSYPLFPEEAFGRNNPFYPDSSFLTSALKKNDGTFSLNKRKIIFRLLPVAWTQQYNSHHPEGINDGAMIPARGYQTMISAGFSIKYDHLSIKIQPEFVYAANKEYDGFPLTRENPELAHLRWYQYYNYYLNYIDAPEQFGKSAYNKTLIGQSSIRLTIDAISLGLSTENLWWGPGMRNSLLMTNSAPGFTHFTLNTVKPIETPIGSFEGQIIAGWLKSSGYYPPEHERNYNGSAPFFMYKLDDTRYINGMVISYHPKWISGLHLGMIRSFQVYHSQKGSKFLDYLPIFSSFSKKAAGDEAKLNAKRRDVYNSVFFRFVWPQSNVEIYGELARSNYFWDSRDLIIQAEHSTAYNLGFRKLFLLNTRKKESIQIHLELTQLAMNANTIQRNGQSMYTSQVVKDGYTNRGQFLGAGIGPGSNLQTLNISWIRSLKKIGLSFERYAHNEDFFFYAVKDIRAHWVDISSSLIGNWDYKKLLFVLELKGILSKNYQWVYDPPLTFDTDKDWWKPGVDTRNFHGKLSIIYRF